MKCSFDKCERKATTSLGVGTNDKGCIPLCNECLRTLEDNESIRIVLILENIIDLIKKEQSKVKR